MQQLVLQLDIVPGSLMLKKIIVSVLQVVQTRSQNYTQSLLSVINYLF